MRYQMKACDLPDMTSELSVAKNSKCDHSQAVQVVKRPQNKKYRVLSRFSFSVKLLQHKLKLCWEAVGREIFLSRMPKKSRYKNVNSVSKKQRYMRKHRTSQSQSPDLEVRRGDCSGPRRREQIHLLFFTIFCFQTAAEPIEAVDSDVDSDHPCDEASPDSRFAEQGGIQKYRTQSQGQESAELTTKEVRCWIRDQTSHSSTQLQPQFSRIPNSRICGARRSIDKHSHTLPWSWLLLTVKAKSGGTIWGRPGEPVANYFQWI